MWHMTRRGLVKGKFKVHYTDELNGLQGSRPLTLGSFRFVLDYNGNFTAKS